MFRRPIVGQSLALQVNALQKYQNPGKYCPDFGFDLLSAAVFRFAGQNINHFAARLFRFDFDFAVVFIIEAI